jgi:hypothetical protein
VIWSYFPPDLIGSFGCSANKISFEPWVIESLVAVPGSPRYRPNSIYYSLIESQSFQQTLSWKWKDA